MLIILHFVEKLFIFDTVMDIQNFIKREKIADHEELAKKVGVSKRTVDSWSSGARTPTYEVCQKLLELGMTVEELFGKPYRSSIASAESSFERKSDFFFKKLFDKIDKIDM